MKKHYRKALANKYLLYEQVNIDAIVLKFWLIVSRLIQITNVFYLM